eukprot:313902_1
MGDVRALCGLMAINNKTEQDLMKVEEKSQESILMAVVGLGHDAAYAFLKRMIDRDLFVKLLFVSNQYNFNVIEGAIAFGRKKLIKDILSVERVKQKYQENADCEFRLLWWLFAYSSDSDIINFVLSELKLSNEDVIGYLDYKYTAEFINKKQHNYHQFTIMTGIPQRNKSINSFRMLVSIIGEKALLKYLFASDGYNMTAIEYCINRNRLEMMKYVMAMDQIRNECLNNEKVLFRVVYWMNKQCDPQMYAFMVQILKTVDKSKLKQVQSYAYPQPKHQVLDKEAISYWDQQITDDMMNKLLNAIK